jgi:hypothetical protein
VWRSTCGVTCLLASDGRSRAALATCLSSNSATARVVSAPPRRVGNSGSSGLPSRSRSHSRSTATVSPVSVAQRSLRPLPMTRQWAPVLRLTSPTRSPTSSETRSPVWIAVSNNRVVAAAEPAAAVGGGE